MTKVQQFVKTVRGKKKTGISAGKNSAVGRGAGWEKSGREVLVSGGSNKKKVEPSRGGVPWLLPGVLFVGQEERVVAGSKKKKEKLQSEAKEKPQITAAA